MSARRFRHTVLWTLLGLLVLCLIGEIVWWADHSKTVEAQVQVSAASVAITNLEYEPWPELTVYINGTRSKPEYTLHRRVTQRRGETIVLPRSEMRQGINEVSTTQEPVNVVWLVVPHHARTRFDPSAMTVVCLPNTPQFFSVYTSCNRHRPFPIDTDGVVLQAVATLSGHLEFAGIQKWISKKSLSISAIRPPRWW